MSTNITQPLINYLRSAGWRIPYPGPRTDWTVSPHPSGPFFTVPRGATEKQLGTVLAGVAKQQGITTAGLLALLNGPAGLDWDMSDWAPPEPDVEGVVGALEGCGDNSTPVVVTTLDGTPVRLLGVTRDGKAVRIVVEVPQP